MIDVIKPYFRARMTTLKYKELTTASFDPKDIDQRANMVFHIELGNGTSSLDQSSVRMTTPVTLRCLYEGGAKVAVNAVDRAASESTKILNEIMKPVNRLNASPLTNIIPTGHSIEALDASNKDVFVLSLTFTALTFLAPQ